MSPLPKISAILLAAGRSSRLGRNKLLLPLGGVPVVRRVARALTQSRAAEVVVVTGHEADEVHAALENLSVRYVHNPDHETGQASSLIAGLRGAAGDAGGFLFALGDQPLITADLIDDLIGAFAAVKGALAAAPFYGGRRGNPVLLSPELRERLESLGGDEGARSVLKTIQDEAPERLAALEVESGDIFGDIDTMDDFEKLQARFGGAS